MKSPNRYQGTCAICGNTVVPYGGWLVPRNRGGGYTVQHIGCHETGRPQVRSITVNTGSGPRELQRNVNGRCEDAPCCGCCNY